ncbi:hypothetical protein KQX54_001386 [Cotesia glomerata]|uniref:Uncharacterized protein n=1 Tax=Cotesia glomerata TaxID=32391 RepID=A0AAV7IEW6_COTGL|nr:hypothetical protein KQX54_001386 [Cotesia glomerata]
MVLYNFLLGRSSKDYPGNPSDVKVVYSDGTRAFYATTESECGLGWLLTILLQVARCAKTDTGWIRVSSLNSGTLDARSRYAERTNPYSHPSWGWRSTREGEVSLSTTDVIRPH